MEQFNFSSGLPDLDRVLQGIRQGDNVVWQTDDLSDYKSFLIPFCRNANAEGKKLVYLRFATHPPLLPRDLNFDIFELDPNKGFATFVSEIISIVDDYGKGVCYVFDCLSGLAVEWFSDRMLGNFFMLICPRLFEQDTVAYFVITHDKHMPSAVNSIHNTAQVVIDVLTSKEKQYILPIKVFNRYSPSLYMLHSRENDIFKPVTKSAVLSEIMAGFDHPWLDFNVDRRDLWTRRLIEAQELYNSILLKIHGNEYAELLKKSLIRMIVTRDESLAKLCEKYFDIANIVCIGKRMIGSGLIGGKAVGMLLARIILKKTDPEWKKRMETHDTFYIGSDVFCTYMVRNKCWWDVRRLKKEKPDFPSSEAVQEKIMNGEFPDEIIHQFRELLLSYFGQSPVIIRSSNILEDAFGNAFSGKYESVFCVNQGTLDERLANFIHAVKTVYASTYSRDALIYRDHRNLLDHKEEEMAVLIHRVSGTFYGDKYFPHIAGVAYSFNPYVWNRRIDPSSGALRLVFGLGTKAVESHGNDYTRVISINEPFLRPESSLDEVRKYSQQLVDVLDLGKNSHVSMSFEEIAKIADGLPIEIFASKDAEMESRAKEFGVKDCFPWVLTFDNFLSKTDFIERMKDILTIVEDAYKCPVDIEFTVNFLNDSSYRINVLQCRPFQCSKKIAGIKDLEEIDDSRIVMKSSGPIIGGNLDIELDRIIYVVPEEYSRLSMQERHLLAKLVGEISNKDPEMNTLVMGPGRWGTKMPSLGIPASFSDIKNVSVLCEIAMMHEGLRPDISFGTHFFNDLVESNTIYIAVAETGTASFLRQDMLLSLKDKILDFVPSPPKSLLGVLRVSHGDGLRIYANVLEQTCVLFK